MIDRPPPDPLAAHAHRRVRVVARESGAHAEQLFRIASLGRTAWTLPDWAAVLATIDGSTETVAQFRAVREL